MKKAFTLAEVLITLTVIGIIAAMVIPSLMADINEKAFDTQRKALYARFSQAIASLPKIAGYGTLTGTLSSGNTQQNVTADTAAETFVTEGLSKVIKMNNMCYSDNITDCGFPSSFTAMGGTTINLSSILTLKDFNSLMMSTTHSDLGKYEQLNTKAAAFETANGESVLVYYNPKCTADIEGNNWHFSQSKMCANFVYDLNGQKAPNTVGKDIGFISVLYPTNPNVVAPMPLTTNAGTGKKQTEALALCKAQDSESRLPSKDELTSMFYNMKLIDIASGVFWSGTATSSGASGTVCSQSFNSGIRGVYAKTNTNDVRCVKK